MRTLVLLVAVVACGGTKPAPESPPPAASMLDCTKVADHVATTVAATRPRPGATHATVKELIASHCKADAWTDELKQCLHAMSTVADGRACAAGMTDEQRLAIRTAARALRKDAGEVAESDEGDWIKHVVEEPDAPK